jgi:DNA polymerase
MALTRDDMLRELELLPVWRAKYIESPISVEPLKANVVEAAPETVTSEAASIESTQLLVPLLAVEEVIVQVPAVEASVAGSSVVSLVHAAPKLVGDACVVCPLVSLSQHADGTSINCLLLTFSPDPATINWAVLFADEQGELLKNMLAAIKFKLSEENFTAFNPLQFTPTSVMIVLGERAAQSLLVTDASLDDLIGKVHSVQGCSAVVTYHPAHLLQNPKDKAKAWQDLLLAQKTITGLQSSMLPSS